MSCEILVVNKSNNELPERSTDLSAGFDLRSTENVEIAPMQRVLVGTGLFFSLPDNYEAQIRPRSGLAYKHGVTVLNSPGTIDADYRGEIKVLLINLSNQTFYIKHGDRIAQVVFAEVAPAKLTPVESIDETVRGEGGFGHTGTK